jgi:hypothetical protein
VDGVGWACSAEVGLGSPDVVPTSTAPTSAATTSTATSTVFRLIRRLVPGSGCPAALPCRFGGRFVDI